MSIHKYDTCCQNLVISLDILNMTKLNSHRNTSYKRYYFITKKFINLHNMVDADTVFIYLSFCLVQGLTRVNLKSLVI